MSGWAEISQKNLFPFSKEQSDFEIALREWSHKGILVDHLFPIETCQLCEHANLRYHFEIVNRETKSILQVGSSCIEKFRIRVYDDEGNELEGQARGKQLREEINAKKQELMMEPLGQLWKISKRTREKVAKYIQAYEKRGGFSPQELLYLFTEMNENGIDYAPHLYKVTLRAKKDREYLRHISEPDRELIWSSLSTAQKKGFGKRMRGLDKKLGKVKECQEEKESYSLFHDKHQQGSSLLDFPIRYSERAHRYKITFFAQSDKAIKRFFRGDLGETRSFIKAEIANNADYEKAEIRLTQTNELLEIYPEG